MKLFKKLRKGFTLIELVVVIAVIAILSAVSVVSYVAITNKAKQSNDQQKIDQVNLSVAAAEISKKPATMHEALESVEQDGFLVENFKAEAKNYEFGYSLSENRFLILDGDKVVYPKEMAKLTKSPDIWKFSSGDSYTDGYSHYLLESVSGSVSVENGGLDVGKNNDISAVSFHSTVSDDYVVRTFGGAVKVGKSTSEVALGQIHLYGLADSNEVYVESTCLHNHGAVGKMELKAGKAMAEKGGIVYLVEAKGTGVAIKENGGKFVIPEDTKLSEISDSVATEAGYTKPSSPSSADATFEEATQTKSNSYDIGNLAELETFRDLVNGGFAFGGCKVKLTANITLNDGWTPIAVGSRDVAASKYVGSYAGENAITFLFKGEFDGQGHTISNLTNKGFVPEYDYVDGSEYAYTYGFFGILDEGAKVSNIKFANVNISKEFGTKSASGKDTGAESVGALVGYAHGNVEISDITIVSGSISSSKTNPACGGVVGRWYDAKSDVSLKNLHNSAKIEGARVAGIIGFISKKATISNKVNFEFENCSNNGQLVGGGTEVNQLACYTSGSPAIYSISTK